MSDLKVSVSVLANTKDVEAYRASSQGGLRLPVGTILASVCSDGSDCGVDVFMPCASSTASEKFAEWFDTNVTGEIESIAKKRK